MADVVIENPILNFPFGEPDRHFRFDRSGIANDVIRERRTSAYLFPIARPERNGGQQLLPVTEWTEGRIQENELTNRMRQGVRMWRSLEHAGVTTTTARLLDHSGHSGTWQPTATALACGRSSNSQTRRTPRKRSAMPCDVDQATERCRPYGL